MKRFVVAAVSAALVVVIVAAGSGADPGQNPNAPRRDGDHGHWFKRACDVAPAHVASCDAQLVTDSAGNPLVTNTTPSGYGPTQFHNAYSLPTTRTERADDRDRRRLRRPEHRGRPGRLRHAVRPARLHDGERLLPQGEPDRRHELPGRERGLVARDRSRRRDRARRSARTARSCSSRRPPARCAISAPPRTRRSRWARTSISNSYGGGESRARRPEDIRYFNHPGVVDHRVLGRRRLRRRVPGRVAVRDRRRRHDAERRRGRQLGLRDRRGRAQAPAARRTSRSPLADGHGLQPPDRRRRVGRRRPEHRRSGLRLRHLPGPVRLVPGRRYEPRVSADRLRLRARRERRELEQRSTPYSHTSSLHDVTSGSNGSCGGSYLCTAGRLRRPDRARHAERPRPRSRAADRRRPTSPSASRRRPRP